MKRAPIHPRSRRPQAREAKTVHETSAALPARSVAPAPFVGRIREIREIENALDSGLSVVLVGSFGSGRTALVRQVAEAMRARCRFVFADFSGTPALASASLLRALAPHRRPETRVERLGHKTRTLRIAADSRDGPTVLVMEDIARFTDPMARFLRFLELRTPFRYLAVVERSLPEPDLAALRRRLAPSALIRLAPLSLAAAARLLRAYDERYRLGWTAEEIRMAAACSLGRPDRIVEVVKRRIGRGPCRGPGTGPAGRVPS